MFNMNTHPWRMPSLFSRGSSQHGLELGGAALPAGTAAARPPGLLRRWAGEFPAAVSVFSRYVKFCVVGLSGMGIDMTILYLLASPGHAGLSLTVAKAAAAQMAICNNFLWNEIWTFRAVRRSAGRKARIARFLRFNMISLSGAALSILILHVLVYALGIHLLAANFLAIVLVSVLTFWINLRFGWKQPPPLSSQNRGGIGER